VELDFRNANPGRGILALKLSQRPEFFLRKDTGGFPSSCWKTCDDWTENKEASLSLQHALEGPAQPLAYIVGYIKDRLANPVNRQPLSPPMVKRPPLSYPGPGSNPFSFVRCRLASPECNATSRPKNRHSNEPKLSSSPYPNHGVPSLSGSLTLQSMPDSQPCDDRTRFINIGAMSGPTTNSPSLLLIPQKSAYSSIQTDRHLSPLLPGLSELFSSTKYS